MCRDDDPGCGQFVRQLEVLAMVEVAVAEHDARARVVRITARGREALARSAEVLRECEETWSAQVGPERWRVFREVLEEVALDSSRAPARHPAGTISEPGRT